LSIVSSCFGTKNNMQSLPAAIRPRMATVTIDCPDHFQSSFKKWGWLRWTKWFRSRHEHKIVCSTRKTTWNKKIESLPADNILNLRPEEYNQVVV
jgi:hypothetical protein